MEEMVTRPLAEALGASAASALCLDAAAAARLQAIAQALLPDVEAIAAEINRRAIAAAPDLADADDAVMQSTRANVGAILSMLAYGVPGNAAVPAEGALKLFERLAGRDDGLAIVLRGYRIGIMELWQIWGRHVAGESSDAAELYELLAASTSMMLTYIDRVSTQLHEQWTVTRRRRAGLDIVPEDIVREALTGDADLSALGYDLARPHRAIALDPSLDDGAVAQLASALALEAAADSVVLHAESEWVVWLALGRPVDVEIRGRLVTLLDAVPGAIGVGDAAPGLDGFRSTHREALDARRVGLLRHDDGITVHHDVALLAVLCADTGRARALARAELGPLGAADESAARLRETLRAFLACGESQTATAHVLDVHQKTVAYRLRQAEALLGRRIGARRAELEAALLLHRAFEGAI